jgi:hypothetical protein
VSAATIAGRRRWFTRPGARRDADLRRAVEAALMELARVGDVPDDEARQRVLAILAEATGRTPVCVDCGLVVDSQDPRVVACRCPLPNPTLAVLA